MIAEYIIGGLGSIILGMCAAIWAHVSRIEDKFDSFQTDCRIRHETVLTTPEFWREHSPLEMKVEALHSRVDKMEARECAASSRADRAEAREMDRR